MNDLDEIKELVRDCIHHLKELRMDVAGGREEVRTVREELQTVREEVQIVEEQLPELLRAGFSRHDKT